MISDTYRGWRPTELLQLGLSEAWYTRQTEVVQFVKLLQQKVDGHDRDLVTIRQVNAFERRMTVSKSIDCLIREVGNAYKTYTAKLLKRGKLENRQIRETVAVCAKNRSVVQALGEKGDAY